MQPDPLGIAGMLVHGRLRIEHAVAEGGFGVIYRGTHLELDRPVAIKCLKVPEGLESEEDRDRFVGRFRAEAQFALDLGAESAAVVRVLDVAAFAMPSGAWIPFMVLEWLDGETLDAFAARWRGRLGRAPTLREVVDLLDPVAQLLARAHARGVAHRDVKPGNVFVCDPGGAPRPKLLDFGVAKAFEEEAAGALTTRTPLHLFAFSPSHGAPEQFERSLGATGPWTDVFALALLVVELLTGQPGLRGQTPGELCVSATSPARPTPAGRGLRLSAAAEEVFARALAISPADRTRDVGAFWRALVEVAAGAHDVAAAPPAPTPPAAPASPPARTEPASPPARTGPAPERTEAAPSTPRSPVRAAPAPTAPLATSPVPVVVKPPLRSSRAFPIAIASIVLLLGVGLLAAFAFSRGDATPPEVGSAPPSATAPAPPSSGPPPASAPAPSTPPPPAPPPAPVACAFRAGARVEVVRAPTDADWDGLAAPRRFPSVNVGYADTVQLVEGTFYAPSRAPHLLLPCAIAKETPTP